MVSLRKILVALVSLSATLCVFASDPAMRIDATTESSFDASHAALVRSLTDAEHGQLIFAELIIQTAATPPSDRNADPSKAKLVPLLAVRSQLDGLNFDQIVALSRSKNVQLKVGFLTEPSN